MTRRLAISASVAVGASARDGDSSRRSPDIQAALPASARSMAPLVASEASEYQLSNSTREATANASVVAVRKRPLTRSAGNPTTTFRQDEPVVFETAQRLLDPGEGPPEKPCNLPGIALSEQAKGQQRLGPGTAAEGRGASDHHRWSYDH